ncbi:MAG TPA: tRNA uridine-5-carboxymethylaminomethyl(34) synthesis GTPase MnmE [Methylocella sp.]|nr:tRNA uridine-5-carboxymethylaminomethyl(34) synthesis GTPase MnmE [Methylocella sp.]
MPSLAPPADTIFALASGVGRAAIAVVRLSGPKTRAIVMALAGALPEPRSAKLAMLRDPQCGEVIDKGLTLFFPSPESFTGEDYAEVQIHGGRAVAAALMAALTLAGARPAGPGEFTRRAVHNGKMDLAAAEGLADLIDAETEWQRRAALRQAEGVLGREAAIWRDALLRASALLAAEIDFPEEDGVPGNVRPALGGLLAPVLNALKSELASAPAAERLREGVVIVIAGPPNAGKSTLLNRLAKRDAAIVSPIAGTTRDLIEVHFDLRGAPVTLIDTAGLRENADAIERIGIARAEDKAKSADLVLWLSDAADPVAPAVAGAKVWPVFTKSDLVPLVKRPNGGLSISAATGENIDALVEKLASFAASIVSGGFSGLIARQRHRFSCEMAASAMERILANPEGPTELIAEDLRQAIAALKRLTGAIDVEDILEEIFSRFCIGK